MSLLTLKRTSIASSWVPGVALSLVGVGLASLIGQWTPQVSVLLIAILLGVVAGNVGRLPEAVEPGLAVAAKRVLRIGIVLLGLQLALRDIVALGVGMVGVVIAVVSVGIAVSWFVGRRLGLTPTQTLLIGCGFSICGAAAVAAVDGVLETEDEEEVVTAIALVVLFGTLMIPLLPLAAGLLGVGAASTGLWAGASIHEVAQVVAVGGALGASALGAAVVVKLARVLLLAPVMVIISLRRRRVMQDADAGGKLPPIMPLFVVGFIAAVAVRSALPIPAAVLDAAKLAQTVCLGAAMFALGTGVKASMIKRVGAKPFALAATTTLVVAAIGLGGVLWVG